MAVFFASAANRGAASTATSICDGHHKQSSAMRRTLSGIGGRIVVNAVLVGVTWPTVSQSIRSSN